ncbi:hypothetical protein EDC04DRAFT_2605591 [Pisolithus marmoratus]|nr:hypothetical protein EDC04DRAFT_2605591 [Pisolithus marmoratus]
MDGPCFEDDQAAGMDDDMDKVLDSDGNEEEDDPNMWVAPIIAGMTNDMEEELLLEDDLTDGKIAQHVHHGLGIGWSDPVGEGTTHSEVPVEFACSHDAVMTYIPIDYHEHLLPLLEDLIFTTRVACLVETSLQELQEHKMNGTLPPGLRERRPSIFDCGQAYRSKIRKRYLDIIVDQKEAYLWSWHRKLDAATWAPKWKEAITLAWNTCLSRLNMTPEIIVVDGKDKLTGWRPSDEGQQQLEEVLADVVAIGNQVIAIEKFKYKSEEEKKASRKRNTRKMVETKHHGMPNSLIIMHMPKSFCGWKCWWDAPAWFVDKSCR